MKRIRHAVLLGAGVSALLLAVLVVRMDWNEFVAALAEVQPVFLVAAAAMVLVSVFLRALRWQVLAELPLKSFPAVWYSEVTGYVGNLIYPGRAGEVLRVAALHHLAHVQPGRAIVSAFVDRLGDVTILAFAAVAVASLVAGLPTSIVIAAVATAAMAIGALAVLLVFARRSMGVVNRLASRLPGEFSKRLPRWYEQAIDAAHLVRRPAVLLPALGLSVAASASDYAIIWLVLRAMGWTLPLAAAVATGVCIALGSLLPAAPGYVGVYQLACVLALAPFGVSESAAVAYSIVLQVVTTAMIGAMGLVALTRYSWLLRRR